MKKITIVLLLFLVSSIGIAQQQTQSSFNYLNPYNLNKSYAGLDTCTRIFFQHKNQWVGVDNAPVNTFLQGHTRLYKNIGIGVGLNRWSAGLLSQIDLSVALAAHFKVMDELTISPSVNLGYGRYTFDANKAVVFDQDAYLNQNQASSGSFYTDFGVLVQYKQIEGGVSLPRTIASKPEFDLSNIKPEFSPETYIKAHASYELNWKTVWDIKPMLVYRTIPQNGDMLDIMASASYNKRFGVALGYRTNSGLIASANVNIKDMFTIGYGYDVAEEQVANLGTGSHEILLGYKFCKAPKEEPLPVKHYFLSGKVVGQGDFPIMDQVVYITEKLNGISDTLKTDSLGGYRLEVKQGVGYSIQVSNSHYSAFSKEVMIDSVLTEQVENIELAHLKNILRIKVLHAKTKAPLRDVQVTLSNGKWLNSDEEGRVQFEVNNQTLVEPMKLVLSAKRDEFLEKEAEVEIQPGEYGETVLNIELQPEEKPDAPKIVDNKVVVNPIYFEVNSAKISDQAAVELNKIIEVMNDKPELVIEVNSHTDCTGSAAGNQRLSDKRAKACVAYIQTKITNPTRISGKGLGESTPITTCACQECSKEEHAQNRRTEFVIKNEN